MNNTTLLKTGEYVLNNCVSPADVVVRFNPSVYNISEGAGVLTLTIERIGPIAQPLTVAITTAGATSSGT